MENDIGPLSLPLSLSNKRIIIETRIIQGEDWLIGGMFDCHHSSAGSMSLLDITMQWTVQLVAVTTSSRYN